MSEDSQQGADSIHTLKESDFSIEKILSETRGSLLSSSNYSNNADYNSNNQEEEEDQEPGLAGERRLTKAHVMTCRICQLFVRTVDRLLDKSEELMDQYLPLTEEEIGNLKEAIQELDTPNTDHQMQACLARISDLSSQLRQRAYMLALSKLRLARRSTQENFCQLHQTITLIEQVQQGEERQVRESHVKLNEMCKSWAQKQRKNSAMDDTDEQEEDDQEEVAVANKAREKSETFPSADSHREEPGTRPDEDSHKEEPEARPDEDSHKEEPGARPDEDSHKEEPGARPDEDSHKEEPGARPDEDSHKEEPGARPDEDSHKEEPEARPDEDSHKEEPGARPDEDSPREEPGARPDEDSHKEEPGARPDEDSHKEEPRARPDEDSHKEEPGARPDEDSHKEEPGARPDEDSPKEEPGAHPGEGIYKGEPGILCTEDRSKENAESTSEDRYRKESRRPRTENLSIDEAEITLTVPGCEEEDGLPVPPPYRSRRETLTEASSSLKTEFSALEMSRNLIYHLQTMYEGLLVNLKDIPASLKNRLHSTCQDMAELHASFARANHFGDLASNILNKSLNIMAEAEDSMDDLMDFAFQNPIGLYGEDTKTEQQEGTERPSSNEKNKEKDYDILKIQQAYDPKGCEGED